MEVGRVLLDNKYENEFILIGELILDSENKYISVLTKDDFLYKTTQEMFELLNQNREVRDLASISDCLSRSNYKNFNIENIFEAIQKAISVNLIEKHIQIQKKIIRDYKICNIIKESNGTLTEEEIKMLYKLTQANFNSKIEVKNLKELSLTFGDELEKRKELFSKGMLFPTGFEELDNLTGGFMKHNIFVIGGRTSLGKTTFMLNLLLNLSNARDTKILYFTCEMSPLELFDRIVSNICELEAYKIKYGKIDFNGEEYRNIQNKLSKINEKANVNLFYAPSLSVDIIRLAIEKYRPEVVFVDHIQLLKVTGITRAQAIEDAMYELKGLCNEFDLAMVCGSQISRESEKIDSNKKEMSPIYFKGSGGIEDCASVTCELKLAKETDKQSKDWIINLDISKNRFGKVGKLTFNFERQKLRFTEIKNEKDII